LHRAILAPRPYDVSAIAFSQPPEGCAWRDYTIWDHGHTHVTLVTVLAVGYRIRGVGCALMSRTLAPPVACRTPPHTEFAYQTRHPDTSRAKSLFDNALRWLKIDQMCRMSNLGNQNCCKIILTVRRGPCRCSGISGTAIVEQSGSALCSPSLRSLLSWLREMPRLSFRKYPVFAPRSVPTFIATRGPGLTTADQNGAPLLRVFPSFLPLRNLHI